MATTIGITVTKRSGALRFLCVTGWCLALIALLGLGFSLNGWRRAEIRERAASAQFVRVVSPFRLAHGWETAGLRVLIVGDSRVAQWAPLPDLPGAAIGISAIPGETAAELAQRLPRDIRRMSSSPDHVIIAAGINDLVAASLSERDVESTAGHLSFLLLEIAEKARASGAAVDIMTIPQPSTPSVMRQRLFWNESVREMVAATNAALASEAPKVGIGVVDINAVLSPGTTPLAERSATDTLHLSRSAYSEINRALMTRLGN